MEWLTAPVAGIGVALGIQYAETPEELETGGRLIQFVLTPRQCQQIAEALTTKASRLLGKLPN